MKRWLVFPLISFVILVAAPIQASDPVTKNYGDITANGWFWLDILNERWDLTQCDLTISYTLDMSEYTPPMWNTAWSSVGFGGGAWGWMASGAPAAAETNPNSQDLDDKLNLGAPDRYDESSYDVTYPDTIVTPPIGNPWLNYGVWFDRDGVDQWQASYWGMIDGDTYNTGGIYEVVVTFHAISPTQGTMFATVNGVQTGFYDSWRNDAPHHYPVGKSISGDLRNLLAFASVWGENVKVYDLTVTGCGAIVIGDCDTGLPDRLYKGKLLSEWIEECALGAANHGKFVSCVAQLTNEAKKAGVITGSEKGIIQSCAAQADIP
jgi:hypothetical protein